MEWCKEAVSLEHLPNKQLLIMDLKQVSTEDLRNELELRGFQTDNLWQTVDVTQNYECDSDVAMDILTDALNNEWVIEKVFFVIDQIAQDEYNIKRKEI